eukprot:TRINITY_DN814_c0_g1_i4.p1 TRINITY_DN814_c0_g1~~TRINITY_DN814_c0_g1_i4.p1  ORF type:complete len:326 (-),score=88.38 TRINITY_DN814_c0_g1_i4:262-1239(-)
MKFLNLLLLFTTLVSGGTIYTEEGPLESVFEFTRGLVKALNEKNEFESLSKCVNNFEPIIDQYIAIWNKLKDFDPTEIVEIIELIKKAADDTSAHFETCAGAGKEIEDLLDALFDFDLISLIAKIITRQEELHQYFNRIANATCAFGAGEALGELVYRFFLDGKLKAIPMFDVKDFIVVVEGFFEAVLNQTAYHDVDKCIKEFEKVYEDFVKAIKKLQDFDINNPVTIINGLIDLFKALIHMLNATKKCSKTPEVFDDMIQKFLDTDIQEVSKRLMQHFLPVVTALYAIMNAIKAKDYRSLGFNIGNIVRILIYGKLPRSPETDY